MRCIARMRETETMNTNEVILLKYGEIVLKGLNRNYFNQLLEKNVRRALKRAPGEYELVYAQSILFVRGKENCGHHPHCLENVKPLADFIEANS